MIRGDKVKEENTVVIGIIEKENERNTNKLLKDIFITLGYNLNYEDSRKNFHILSRDNKNIIIINLNSEMLVFTQRMKIEFHIIIHKHMDYNDSEEKILKDIVSKSKYLLINSDDTEWNHLLNDNINTIIITYGFNNRATINPSSHNISDLIEVNICIQRKILTIDNKTIDPFDLPIKIGIGQNTDIYSILSVIGCMLIFNMDVFSLATTVFQQKRHGKEISRKI